MSIRIGEVLSRDVELGVSLNLKAGLSDRDHEFVELGKELLFHIIRPRVLRDNGWDEDVVHESD